MKKKVLDDFKFFLFAYFSLYHYIQSFIMNKTVVSEIL